MARVLKWQEKLVLACAALLFSVTSGLGLGPRDSSGPNRSSSSRMVIVGKSGVELMAHRPYVRLVHASLIPVSLPLAAGAYVTMAGSPGVAASAAAAPAGSSCNACDTATAPCCSIDTNGGCCRNDCGGGDCYTVYCSGSFQAQPPGQHTCQTCGYGTCGVCC